jgi:RNA polymerase sigma-70 factor, ECF subfamily
MSEVSFFITHEAALSGNGHGEFEVVALPHASALLRYAMHLASERARAEDLVQETLLSAWRNFQQFTRGTNCKAWLFRILTNLYYKQVRRSRRHPEVQVEEHKPGLVAPERVSSGQELRQAFARLSAEHQQVLHLAVVEGFDMKEIADLLQVPQGTVMSRLSRARASLRNALQTRPLAKGVSR